MMAGNFLPLPIPALAAEIQSSSSSSIYVRWALRKDRAPVVRARRRGAVRGYRVHYQKVASSYVQYSRLLPPSASTYTISNLVADTDYKVCVVMYRNDTNSPDRDCVDGSTSTWHIPVSIGSSIGALLALVIIVLIVLLSRCPSLRRSGAQGAAATGGSQSSKYDSMRSSRYHDGDHSDTATQCQEDDVFSDNDADSQPPLSAHLCQLHHHPCPHYAHHHHHHHHHHSAFSRGFEHKPHLSGQGPYHQPKRAHSLATCNVESSLERPRPHHHPRRSHLIQLHSNHQSGQSIQSEPAMPQGRSGGGSESRSLHVSISDLPPAVHVTDLDAPVASLASGVCGASCAVGMAVGGPRLKSSVKNTARI